MWKHFRKAKDLFLSLKSSLVNEDDRQGKRRRTTKLVVPLLARQPCPNLRHISSPTPPPNAKIHSHSEHQMGVVSRTYTTTPTRLFSAIHRHTRRRPGCQRRPCTLSSRRPRRTPPAILKIIVDSIQRVTTTPPPYVSVPPPACCRQQPRFDRFASKKPPRCYYRSDAASHL